MSLLYADTSALARIYLDDEPEHRALRDLLLEGAEPVVTSELSSLELTSAMRGAERAGRGVQADGLLARMGTDLSRDGSIQLLRLRPERVLPTARRLLLEHRLRSLDAIHLAVALEEAPALALDGDVVLVTRDDDQAAAARALGLTVR